jgi:hypothetical protein
VTTELAWARPEPYRQPGKNFVLVILAISVSLVVTLLGFLAWVAWNDRAPRRAAIGYQQFLTLVRADAVHDVVYENATGDLAGTFAKGHREKGLSHFKVHAQPDMLPPSDVSLLAAHHVLFDPQFGAGPGPNLGYLKVDAFMWTAFVVSLLQLLAWVGVGGLIWIRYRASRSLSLQPHIV